MLDLLDIRMCLDVNALFTMDKLAKIVATTDRILGESYEEFQTPEPNEKQSKVNMHRVASVTTMYNDEGPFSENAPQNKEMMDQSKKLFISTIDTILGSRDDLRDQDSILIADFGAADGGATIQLIRDVVDYLKEINGNGKREVIIVFDDIPGNDFNDLAKRIYDGSAIKDSRSIHYFMSAQTMYSPCLPKHSLDLGFCCQFALQFLSERPTRITNGIFPSEANDEEMALIKAQAEKDWKKFLLCRARELKPGGCVIVFVGIESDNGKQSGLIPFPHKRLSKILKEFVENGTISQDEFHSINVDSYTGRSESDIRAAFIDPDVQQSNLQIKSLNCVRRLAIPALRKDESSDEIFVAAHAKKVTRFVRSCLFKSIVSGLSSWREEESKNNIAESFFKKLHDLILKEEPNVSYINQYAEIVLQKNVQVHED